ncbi:hypothetical protein [Methylobacterium sp. J-076]|uniref:hypothetical protein n=1 Tax=Methylobacterium sp. J-076 TaxID=2836655 RepID=UPI001FB91EDB|nr:hypothetical protein [Methylobacterium sp. J-076]MCJ2012149.1 hypothetical protein [Methylobacterium sp. J-076]
MSNRRPLNWNAALRDLNGDRLAVVPGLVTARNRVSAFAGFRKTPLFAAGQFNRSAIMALAVEAARDHQGRYGGTWAQAMSVCLKAAWQAAKIARTAAAH